MKWSVADVPAGRCARSSSAVIREFAWIQAARPSSPCSPRMNSSAAAWASKNRWRHRSTFSAGSKGDGSLVMVRVPPGGSVQLGEDLLGDAQPVVGDRPATVVRELNDDFDDLLS